MSVALFSGNGAYRDRDRCLLKQPIPGKCSVAQLELVCCVSYLSPSQGLPFEYLEVR
jgi:hypothetical protein